MKNMCKLSALPRRTHGAKGSLWIIALAAIIGFGVAACGGGSAGSSGSGTSNGSTDRLFETGQSSPPASGSASRREAVYIFSSMAMDDNDLFDLMIALDDEFPGMDVAIEDSIEEYGYFVTGLTAQEFAELFPIVIDHGDGDDGEFPESMIRSALTEDEFSADMIDFLFGLADEGGVLLIIQNDASGTEFISLAMKRK